MLKARHENPEADLSAVLAAVCLQAIGRRLPYTDEDLQRILSPRHFVQVRRTLGGPAPEETGRALGVSEALLDDDHAWLTGRREALARRRSPAPRARRGTVMDAPTRPASAPPPSPVIAVEALVLLALWLAGVYFSS